MRKRVGAGNAMGGGEVSALKAMVEWSNTPYQLVSRFVILTPKDKV